MHLATLFAPICTNFYDVLRHEDLIAIVPKMAFCNPAKFGALLLTPPLSGQASYMSVPSLQISKKLQFSSDGRFSEKPNCSNSILHRNATLTNSEQSPSPSSHPSFVPSFVKFVFVALRSLRSLPPSLPPLLDAAAVARPARARVRAVCKSHLGLFLEGVPSFVGFFVAMFWIITS